MLLPLLPATGSVVDVENENVGSAEGGGKRDMLVAAEGVEVEG